MRRSSWAVRVVLLIVSIVSLTAFVHAQYGASLQGTVTDKTGAVVKGAKVTVTNQATGANQTTETSGSGFYRVASLIPGQYTVDVESGGFRKSHAANVQVDAENVRGLDVALEAGGTQETVNVTSEVTAVQTENANINGTLTEQEIKRLPQYGRDPYELLRFAPGVFGDGARKGTGESQNFVNTSGPGSSTNSIFATENVAQVSANGQRPSGNNFTIDGTSTNSLTWGGAAILTPNQESIAEVNVTSSTYSAEDGRNTGAQVKAISKSGTNQIHGTGFFTYDDPGLNAYNRWGGFQTANVPERVKNKNRQFGGGIGGPVLKDKLFFFFSYEGNRNHNPSYAARYVETPQFIDFMNTNRAGAVETQLLTATGARPRILQVLAPDCNEFKNQWPQYTYSPGGVQGIDGSGCQIATQNGVTGVDLGSPALSYGQYVPTWNVSSTCPPTCVSDTTGGGFDGIPDLQKVLLIQPNKISGNQYNTRIDYHQGKNQFAGSFYITPLDTTVFSGNGRPNQDINSKWRNGLITFLWNRSFSATLLNEARFNATRWHNNEYDVNRGSNWGLPNVEMEDIPLSRIIWGSPQGDNSPGLFAQNQFEFRDVVSKLHGRHGLKAGFGIAWAQDNNDYMFGDQRPIYTYHGIWSFVNGAPIFEGVNADPRTGNFTDNHKYFRQHDISWFVQDDLKLRPNLTVNLGLRYEFFSPLQDKFGHLANLILNPATDYVNGLKNATLKVTNPLYPADKKDFSPRLGFAWSPSKLNNKAVFRAGFGMGYNRVSDTMTGISRVNPPFVYRYGVCCAASNTDRLLNGWMAAPYAPAFDVNNQFLGNQIVLVQSQTGIHSITGYPGNPALATNPQTGLPNNAFIEIWGAPQNFKTPYVYSYSLDFQYELPHDFVATLGYQGSSSRRLLRIVNLNNIYAHPSPFANVEYFPSTDSNANYNALLANVNHRFSHGVQMFAKYRWAKSIDEVTGEGAGSYTNQFYPINQSLGDRGPSDFDTTHSFMIAGLWDIPFPGSKGTWASKLLGGWHIDPTFQVHSGFPWSPVSGNNCPPVPQGGTICPALPRAYLGGAGNDYSTSTFQKPGGNFPNGAPTYFDTSTPGPPFVKRNSFRGPRYSAFDVGVGKETRLPFVTSEGATLDFRANIFNLFNKLNLIPFAYNSDSTNITSCCSRFGQAGGALAGRVIEFQTRLTF